MLKMLLNIKTLETYKILQSIDFRSAIAPTDVYTKSPPVSDFTIWLINNTSQESNIVFEKCVSTIKEYLDRNLLSGMNKSVFHKGIISFNDLIEIEILDITPTNIKIYSD